MRQIAARSAAGLAHAGLPVEADLGFTHEQASERGRLFHLAGAAASFVEVLRCTTQSHNRDSALLVVRTGPGLRHPGLSSVMRIATAGLVA